jgi:hypothetical protein
LQTIPLQISLETRDASTRESKIKQYRHKGKTIVLASKTSCANPPPPQQAKTGTEKYKGKQSKGVMP